jgi:C1A family cysteine protease
MSFQASAIQRPKQPVKSHTLMRFVFFLVSITMVLSVGSFVSAQDVQPAQWKAEITVDVPAAADARAVVMKKAAGIQNKGITVSLSNETEKSITITMKGSGSVSDIREVLSGEGLWQNMLSGHSEMKITGKAVKGNKLVIEVESNPSTGYSWTFAGSDGEAFILQREGEFEPRSSVPGRPAKQKITLQAVKDGDTTVNIRYRRPWEPVSVAKSRMTIDLGELSGAMDLSDSTRSAGIEKVAPTLPVRAVELVPGLPTSWDWRSHGGGAAVRDQGACGSCWAFGTVGVMEDKLKINQKIVVDLSEQYLISCNSDGWSCDGGWWAHDYHATKLGNLQSVAGAVLEADMPYTVSNGTCQAIAKHPYKIASWYHVNYEMATVDEIKNAIYKYGPVATTLCVGDAFNDYTGGVFSTDEASICGEGILNHAIVLMGWDDSTQTWILKNSWGTSWGESGYMNIKWGISNIGYRTSYVLLDYKPDFVIKHVDFNPVAPVINQKFSVTVTVQNRGKASGNAGLLKIWLNSPTARACDENANSSKPVGTLAAGASKIITFTGLEGGAAGTKTFRALIDGNCITSEASETNNQFVKLYPVGPPIPDFIISKIKLSPGRPYKNGIFRAKITVKNQGTKAGDAGRLSVWRDSPTPRTCGEKGRYNVQVGVLEPGGSKTFTFRKLLSGQQEMVKTFRAFVDGNCAVSESYNTNNQRTKAYRVGF